MRWLGIGTGRCGTKSLARWGGAGHETIRLPFEMDPVALGVLAKRMAQDQPEVSFMWTAHWQEARKIDPDLPIIVLHRDKFDTVASHIRICNGKDRLVPGRMPGKFSESYPTLKDQRDSWLAWGHWWDVVEWITADIPQPVWHMEMEDLNHPEELAHLERWLQNLGRWD